MAAASEAPKMQATLGLTGVTVNAMALIAPGAFLWISSSSRPGTYSRRPWQCGPGLFLLCCLPTPRRYPIPS
jgi:hypothetical protein